MYKHLQHQISFIESTMEYVLIAHLLGIFYVNIILYKVGQNY